MHWLHAIVVLASATRSFAQFGNVRDVSGEIWDSVRPFHSGVWTDVRRAAVDEVKKEVKQKRDDVFRGRGKRSRVNEDGQDVQLNSEEQTSDSGAESSAFTSLTNALSTLFSSLLLSISDMFTALAEGLARLCGDSNALPPVTTKAKAVSQVETQTESRHEQMPEEKAPAQSSLRGVLINAHKN